MKDNLTGIKENQEKSVKENREKIEKALMKIKRSKTLKAKVSVLAEIVGISRQVLYSDNYKDLLEKLRQIKLLKNNPKEKISLQVNELKKIEKSTIERLKSERDKLKKENEILYGQLEKKESEILLLNEQLVLYRDKKIVTLK